MTGRRRTAPGPAGRAYRKLLAFYPASFRERYAPEAARLFDDLYRATLTERGRLAAARYAASACVRAAVGAVAERWSEPGESLRRAQNDLRTTGRSPMRHDVTYALRSLRKSPGFALTVILLLATGIGATTAVFSVVDGVVLRGLPYPEPERLVYVENGSHPPADVRDWEATIGSVAAWGGVWNEEMDLTGEGPPERLGVGRVTTDLFGMLGIRASLGRLFAPDEFVPEPDVALVSQDLWRRRWGGDPDLVGDRIQLGGRPYTVIGVLGERPPDVLLRGSTGVWLPLDLRDPEIQDRGLHTLSMAGRLAEGATLDRARAEMVRMDRSLAERFPDTHLDDDGEPTTAPLTPLSEIAVGSVRVALLVLLGAVGLLLLIACANVAHLLLARGADRTREMALRGALGATRGNMARQLAAESLLLSLAGGGLGVGVAAAGLRLFRWLDPGALPRADAIALDGRVLVFTLAVSLATGLLFGLVPALRAGRVDVSALLKGGGGTATGGVRRTRLQGTLVVAEVALSMMLLAGAGVLLHSFVQLTSVDPGFEPERLVTVELQLLEPYDPASRERFAERLLERLRNVPGAQGVVGAVTLPFQYPSGGSCCWRTGVVPAADAGGTELRASIQPVMPAYFTTMGVPLVAGRDLARADGDVSPVPVVLNETAAVGMFGTPSVVGRELEYGGERGRIVGVAADVRHLAFESGAVPEVYIPWRSRGPDMPFLNFGIRTSAPLSAVAPAIRAAVWAQDPDLPVPDIVPMAGRMARSVAQERFYSVLLAGFAGIALLLAAGGLYATLVYAVRQRRREVGIRLALGARAADVVRMILRRGLLQTAAGLALGLLGALAGVRVLESMVFGISTRDPRTLLAVSAVLATVAAVACLLPALRAGRTDPVETLRAE